MEPNQARLTLGIFIMLSAFIVFNALNLQVDAGLVPGSALSAGQVAGQPVAVATRPESGTDDLLPAIRRELSRLNYFTGVGQARQLDPVTLGAIMAYQHDKKLEVTGRYSEELLKSFLFGVDKKMRQRHAGHKAGSRVSAPARQLIAEIQGVLSARGYYKGRIDGLFMKGSARAVRRYEREQNLPVTGRISGLLVRDLERRTGIKFNKSL